MNHDDPEFDWLDDPAPTPPTPPPPSPPTVPAGADPADMVAPQEPPAGLASPLPPLEPVERTEVEAGAGSGVSLPGEDEDSHLPDSHPEVEAHPEVEVESSSDLGVGLPVFLPTIAPPSSPPAQEPDESLDTDLSLSGAEITSELPALGEVAAYSDLPGAPAPEAPAGVSTPPAAVPLVDQASDTLVDPAPPVPAPVSAGGGGRWFRLSVVCAVVVVCAGVLGAGGWFLWRGVFSGQSARVAVSSVPAAPPPVSTSSVPAAREWCPVVREAGRVVTGPAPGDVRSPAGAIAQFEYEFFIRRDPAAVSALAPGLSSAADISAVMSSTLPASPVSYCAYITEHGSGEWLTRVLWKKSGGDKERLWTTIYRLNSRDGEYKITGQRYDPAYDTLGKDK